MNKSLMESILKNLKEKTSEWTIQFGTAKRIEPYVEIEIYWKNIVVGGVSQKISRWQWRAVQKAINDEAERRYTLKIAPGKEAREV